MGIIGSCVYRLSRGNKLPSPESFFKEPWGSDIITAAARPLCRFSLHRSHCAVFLLGKFQLKVAPLRNIKFDSCLTFLPVSRVWGLKLITESWTVSYYLHQGNFKVKIYAFTRQKLSKIRWRCSDCLCYMF